MATRLTMQSQTQLLLGAGNKLLLGTSDTAGCCCGGKCVQVVIPGGGASGGIDWPGLNVSLSGDIILYGTYDGVPNGFWQGRSETGTAPSAVTLTFSDKKPQKIVVLCSAMNTGENQSFTVQGTASEAYIDGVRPAGTYNAGPIGPNSGTINRADSGGMGDSHFRLTVKSGSNGNLNGFVWSHATTQNMNGMVNAIFLCDNEDEPVNFV